MANNRVTGTLSKCRITKRKILGGDPAASSFSVAVGRARSQELVADVDVRLARLLDLSAVYALVDTGVLQEDIVHTTPQPIRSGTELANVPAIPARSLPSIEPAVSRAASPHRRRPHLCRQPGTHAGRRRGRRRPVPPARPGHSASLVYQVTQAVELYVDAENLFDQRYLASSYKELRIASGTPRAIRSGVRLTIM